ncbi:MAG: hypothetical protein JKY80_02915 [Mariprofundaceae bacterium]|nr:hypothetical protein [Mariprofundaceae bacterium]
MTTSHNLQRRGFELGEVTIPVEQNKPSKEQIIAAWQANKAITIPAIAMQGVVQQDTHIQAAHRMMETMLDGAELAETFEEDAINQRLRPEFALLASSAEEHDEQGIEKVYFDVEEGGDICAEDLWCKASWLSFHDEDASLRFRFSFGMEGFEDVAADPARQVWSGELCERVFPESSIITKNTEILSLLQEILGKEPAFVERIVYFNAPNGGAQFHHDVERGHAGVVFAQLSGATFWLALDKQTLMDEMIHFAQNHAVNDDLKVLMQNREVLSDYMEEQDHAMVEEFIDQRADFIRYLIDKGYSHSLQAGDVLFLPQQDLDHCVWHTVFTLGDEPGEALSFAVR